jgi:ABC-type spermidine/putrescine transport system permease subunit II
MKALFMLPLIVPVILIAAAIYELETRLNLTGTVRGYALGHTVLALPFTVLICTGALQQVGTSLEEAARSLGAGRLTAFRRATLPLIMPSVCAAAAIAFVTSWDEVVIALFLKGFDATLPVTIYTFVSQDLRPTVAAVSTLILAGILIVGSTLLAGSSIVRRRRRQAI